MTCREPEIQTNYLAPDLRFGLENFGYIRITI
jgi:hypothetical protein